MQRLEQLDKLDDDAIDRKLRRETFCRGCGDPKGYGLVVCWNCFKYRNIGPNGVRDTLKYATEWGIASGLRQWLHHIDRAWPRMALDTIHLPRQRALVGSRVDYGDGPSDADPGL